MGDYYTKKLKKIVGKINSNTDSPYTVKDKLKWIRKQMGVIYKYVMGISTLNDNNNKELMDLLYIQEQPLNIIFANLNPLLNNEPTLEFIEWNNNVLSVITFPLRKINAYFMYILKIFCWKVRRNFSLQCIGNSLIALNNLGIVKYDRTLQTFNLTSMAKKIFYDTSEKDLSSEELERLYNWTLDIGDKQYRAYDWNDNKVQCLLTVDAALMAGVIFILQLLGEDTITITSISLGIFALSFLFLVISLIICLIHSIPILNSKLGDGHNLRTIVGIESFARYEAFFNTTTKHERRFRATNKYFESISNLNMLDMVHMNAWQIVGMSRNNVTSNVYIRKGVIATILGVITLMIAVGIMAVQNMI